MEKIKRIKENVTERDYKLLMAHVRGSDSLRDNTKRYLGRTFTCCYYLGLRVNEMQELKILNIVELFEKGETKFITPKMKNERKLFMSDLNLNMRKDLSKVFDLSEDPKNLVITKGSNKNKKTGINKIVFIQKVNEVMKIVLGAGYTSHSFRQGLISEMASKKIDSKITAKFMNIDVKTVMRYVTPTDDDVKNAMVR